MYRILKTCLGEKTNGIPKRSFDKIIMNRRKQVLFIKTVGAWHWRYLRGCSVLQTHRVLGLENRTAAREGPRVAVGPQGFPPKVAVSTSFHILVQHSLATSAVAKVGQVELRPLLCKAWSVNHDAINRRIHPHDANSIGLQSAWPVVAWLHLHQDFKGWPSERLGAQAEDCCSCAE